MSDLSRVLTFSCSENIPQYLLFCGKVPAISPSGGGDVGVYVFDINEPSLPTPVYYVLEFISLFMVLSTVFHFINSPPQLSAFSLCSSGLI